jgi:hypothetical protein
VIALFDYDYAVRDVVRTIDFSALPTNITVEFLPGPPIAVNNPTEGADHEGLATWPPSLPHLRRPLAPPFN